MSLNKWKKKNKRLKYSNLFNYEMADDLFLIKKIVLTIIYKYIFKHLVKHFISLILVKKEIFIKKLFRISKMLQTVIHANKNGQAILLKNN